MAGSSRMERTLRDMLANCRKGSVLLIAWGGDAHIDARDLPACFQSVFGYPLEFVDCCMSN